MSLFYGDKQSCILGLLFELTAFALVFFEIFPFILLNFLEQESVI